ncbi:MAG: hypothetical protein ACYDAD_02305 [Acidimicrobiales bacterium]
MDLDLTDVERELCRLPDVNAARIVADEIGRPTEVHILAAPHKHAKQIARDVASVAMASFGLDLDRRIISVVQLDGGPGTENGQDAAGNGHLAGTGSDAGASGSETGTGLARIQIAGIAAEQHGMRARVRVTLTRDEDQGTGFAEGSVATSARHRLLAQATLDALRELMPVAECADVEMATILRVGLREVAVTAVSFVVPPHEEIVSGSAVVRTGNEADAVARAVLDATNRRLVALAVR